MHRRGRRGWGLGLFAGLALAIGALLAAPAAHATPATEAFVQKNIDQGYEILNDDSLARENLRARFRAFMLGLTDIRRIGMFTLGQYARGADEAQLDEFIDSFTEYAVAVYETRLSKYKGQTLKVTGSTDRASGPNYDSVVNAVVINPNAPNATPINAAFRVRPDMKSGKPIITDMQVEGVWLAINQRADFTAFLQQHNGSIPELSSHLRDQAAALRSGAPG
jgi:phospholipid transport system substrate-binding protein